MGWDIVIVWTNQFSSWTGVKIYRVPKIERPSIHRTLCQIVRYAPMLFVKVTLYSVDVFGKIWPTLVFTTQYSKRPLPLITFTPDHEIIPFENLTHRKIMILPIRGLLYFSRIKQRKLYTFSDTTCILLIAILVKYTISFKLIKSIHNIDITWNCFCKIIINVRF